MARQRRFTIYDVLDANGFFEANTANSSAGTDYKRLDFPKMYYHPRGDQIVVVPAEAIATPFGPKMVGEQRRLISKLVNNPEEEAFALADGWHNHPSKSIAAGGGEAAPVNAGAVVADLEAQIARLQAALNGVKAETLGGAGAAGQLVKSEASLAAEQEEAA